MLGRAGGLAHRPRGKRGERRRGQSGCLCFIWNCPPQATRGRPRLEAVWPADAHTHTHMQYTQLVLDPSLQLELLFYIRDLIPRLSSPAFRQSPRRLRSAADRRQPRTGAGRHVYSTRCHVPQLSQGLSPLTQRSLSTVYKHSDTGSSVY